MEAKELEVKKKYMNLELIENKIKSVQENIAKINSEMSRVEQIKATLEAMESQKNDEDALLTVSDGVFVKGKITQKDNLYINVGQGVVVKKSYADAYLLIQDQKSKLEQSKKKLSEMLANLESQALEIENQLRSDIQ